MAATAPDRPPRVAFMLELVWNYNYHTEVFAGAQTYADAHGWESTIDEFVAERLPADRKSPPPYDGVIARASKKLADAAGKIGLPVVNVWGGSPVFHDLPGSFVDNEASGRLAAEHLLSRGLRNFAVVGVPDRAERRQMRGFRNAVTDAGFPCTATTISRYRVVSLSAWTSFERRLEQFMDRWQPPIGVYTVSEDVGRHVVQACRSRGWRVPGDVAIVAGKNEESVCLQPRPSLTSIDMGYRRVGYEAARLLDELMQRPPQRGRKSAAPKHVVTPPNGLVIRESTDFFAVTDPLVAAALEFIAANSHRQISAEEIAEATRAGLRTLQKQFSECLGRSISEEVQRVRLERAKRELVQSNRTVKEIAADVGFLRAARMIEAFRRTLGQTPGEYRKRHRTGD
jgi:LacI family transcriptional regulator